jgi:hypothetical protein
MMIASSDTIIKYIFDASEASTKLCREAIKGFQG